MELGKKTALSAALIASLLASYGGSQFLKKNPNPTLRDVYVACEKGDVRGIACCEDMLRVKDMNKQLEQCGMIQPGQPDPFGVRKMEEDAWDHMQAEQLKGIAP